MLAEMPLRSIQERARLLASNSTGRVTIEKSVVTAKRATQVQRIVGLLMRLTPTRPAIMMKLRILLESWTAGTIFERKVSQW